MKVAIEGCGHGALDAIYQHIASLEKQFEYKVDLLLMCGDFQAIRNHSDLNCMAVPEKYRELGGFYKYYTGEKKAPILTLVIGGNHEASNYLWELYHGGWLAPNIYYLGAAGCVNVNGVRIAGASGIFKSHDYNMGHFETLPLNGSALRSIYHIRQYDVSRLALLSSPTVFLSHDWPQSIEHHGDLNNLLRRKPFFRADIEKGELGSPPLLQLMGNLKPQWWFSAHLHVRFEATVVHPPPGGAPPVKIANPDEIVMDDDEFEETTPAVVPAEPEQVAPPRFNPDEILLEDEEEEVVVPPLPPVQRVTNFLALDKCLPKRDYLEVIDIPTTISSPDPDSPPRFTYDIEWLGVTRAFHPYLSLTREQTPLPALEKAKELVKNEVEWVKQRFDGKAPLVESVQVFSMTAPGPDLSKEKKGRYLDPIPYNNPQTEALCQMLDLRNKINVTANPQTIPDHTVTHSTIPEGGTSIT